MKFIVGLLFVALTFSNCASNRYILSDGNGDKDFLKEQIKEFKKTEGLSNKPILVIDGIPHRYNYELKEKPLNFSKSDIKEISILKKDVGTRIYGDQAKDGVILITLNDTTDDSLEEEAMTLAEMVKNGKAVFFVNGIETSIEDVLTIEPNTVEELTILKREAANKLFPERDLDGIVYIKTKNK